MYARNGNAERARWQVLWEANGYIQSKDFETDHSEAVKFYVKLQGRRDNVTLRCMNMQFPPPAKYKNVMEQVNAKGILWCGFCGEMRRFVRRDYFILEGLQIDEPAHVCPMCEVSARVVQAHNPLAYKFTGVRRYRKDRGQGR